MKGKGKLFRTHNHKANEAKVEVSKEIDIMSKDEDMIDDAANDGKGDKSSESTIKSDNNKKD